MAIKTDVEITTEIDVIRNETLAKQNTRGRVANSLQNIFDTLRDKVNGYVSNSAFATAISDLTTAIGLKANTSHVHSGADITSGTINNARIGTDSNNRFVKDTEKALFPKSFIVSRTGVFTGLELSTDTYYFDQTGNGGLGQFKYWNGSTFVDVSNPFETSLTNTFVTKAGTTNMGFGSKIISIGAANLRSELNSAELFFDQTSSGNFCSINIDGLTFSRNAGSDFTIVTFVTPTGNNTINFPDESGTVLTTSQKGVFNGVASLDGAGQVPLSQLGNAPSGGGGGGTWGSITGTLSAQTDLNSALNAKEAITNKDSTGGYAGLTLFKINFKNVANTFISFFTNSNTASRTYTFKDADGTIAFTSDITGTNSGTNTGDETAPRIGAIVNGATNYTTPLDADKIGIWDVANSLFKSVTWSNIKATLKTYFDGFYMPFTGGTFTGKVVLFASTSTVSAIRWVSGVAVTSGWSNGDSWYETTLNRLRFYKSSQIVDFLFSKDNADLTGSSTSVLTANSTGDITRGNNIVSLFQFVQTTPVTVTAASLTSILSGTVIGTTTLLASTDTTNPMLVAGKSYRIVGSGIFSSLVSATFQIDVRIGSVTLLDSTALTMIANTNKGFRFDVIFTTLTTGASGTMIANLVLFIDGQAPFVVSGSSVTIDTTADRILDIRVAYGATNASNTITIRQFKGMNDAN